MIIVFGSAGALGQTISNSLLRNVNTPVLMTANSSLEDILVYEEKYPDRVITRECDVSDPDDVEKIFSFVRQKNIEISGIVNNFAFTFNDDGNNNYGAHNDEVKKIFEVNYFGLSKILECTVDWALENDISGIRVVNVLSNSLRTLNASNSHYIASKSAVETLSRFYAKRFSENISVNCIAPGLMKSKLTASRFDVSEQKIIDLTPLGRLASPDEIAELVTYFVMSSPVSVCGQTIYVDGGRTL